MILLVHYEARRDGSGEEGGGGQATGRADD